ncbi:hypothetical protein QRX60_35530 [Amycolatopsis mongoliensis]|uniref:Uncharacterized protein n=1 Tax=Amycolatopsis mongoliensis TaxID=715475 RepID=A0A9Y2JL61_9PSEU|nr:hypothetical protein [Amycolatopsis sp. 4-36]WIX99333.1 hypothetical protein QRX60_35530 [Amycolatopsis sp. 4-36]
MPSPRDRFEIYPDRQPSSRALDGDDWIEARAGGLEAPILARVGRSRDGRPVITGLMIGEFDDGEITADTLRAIRPRALLAQLFEDFDPGEPPSPATAAEGELPDLLDDDLMTWGLMQEHVSSPAREQAPDQMAVTPPRGPSLDQLRRFAEVYQREWERFPHRAMTATAEAMTISRPTANRWAKQCRERGLLPPK